MDATTETATPETVSPAGVVGVAGSPGVSEEPGQQATPEQTSFNEIVMLAQFLVAEFDVKDPAETPCTVAIRLLRESKEYRTARTVSAVAALSTPALDAPKNPWHFGKR